MNQERESFFARNRSYDEISKSRAIANLNDGLEMSIHDASTKLLAWPGTEFKWKAYICLRFKQGKRAICTNMQDLRTQCCA